MLANLKNEVQRSGKPQISGKPRKSGSAVRRPFAGNDRSAGSSARATKCGSRTSPFPCERHQDNSNQGKRRRPAAAIPSLACLRSCQARFIERRSGGKGLAVNVVVDVREFVVKRIELARQALNFRFRSAVD